MPIFVILTKATAPSIEFIHDRMPVILTGDQRQQWRNYDMSNIAEIIPDGLEYEAC